MKRKYPFTPILGWSVSRYDKFEGCKRQYWYDYYAKKFDRDIAPERIDTLKSLTSTHLEIGNIVHDVIATQLHILRRNIIPDDTNEILKYSYHLVDRALGSKNFLEVHYGQKDKIDVDDLKMRVGNCLKNFFASPWYQWLLADGEHRRGDWVIEPNDFGEVRINGMKAYCKVDFLFPMSEGLLCVLDWKTGKVDREKHRKQMTGYVVYAQDIFKVAAEKVRPVVVYLGGAYEELENSFSQNELDAFAEEIAAETKEMYEYCKDVNENIPKSKESFPKQVRKLCAYCSYQELCND